jgi:hypothetical protein
LAGLLNQPARFQHLLFSFDDANIGTGKSLGKSMDFRCVLRRKQIELETFGTPGCAIGEVLWHGGTVRFPKFEGQKRFKAPNSALTERRYRIS